ncbi:SH3 domain-containing protein [Penicillium herquei]|nr:SH3 domain-containing protein [Penicillium herquei]
MSTDEIQPVSEVLASTGTQVQTPPAEPTPAATPAPPAAPAPAPARASKARQTPIAGHRNGIHNPFPASLASECRKAGQIIDSFVNPRYARLDGAIPQRILAPAKGLVICSVFKAGFLGSVRFGSGLIVCRLPDGSWSAPSAISLGGLGAGGQFGMEFTNFVFVLNTDAAVTTFINSGALTLGGNISIAFGTGRSAETAAMIGTKGVAGIFAYSKTRGVYGGLTLEGGMIVERSSANKKLYGRKLKAKELLTGEVPPPPEAEPLMQILNSEAFRVSSVGEQSSAGDAPVSVADAQVTDAPTTEAAVAEAQAAKPSIAENQNAENQNAEDQNAEDQNAETQATDTQATETQATDSQATETQATDAQAIDSQATETQATETQATETQNAENQATETQATETQATETQATETQNAVISATGVPETTPVKEALDAGAHTTESSAVEAQAADIQARETPLPEVTPHQPIEPATGGVASEPKIQVPRVPNSEIDGPNESKEAS